jgi:hypothetical protein
MTTGLAPLWGNMLWLAAFAGGMVILQRVYSNAPIENHLPEER